MDAELDIKTKTAVLKAFNKVIWIQNDCTYRNMTIFQIFTHDHLVFARHYLAKS